MPFKLICADITTLASDAIVNPTDMFYSGGGGVDYLIHKKCGRRLRDATYKLPILHLGEAHTTQGFRLPCKYIIHTSGPKWKESHYLETSLLGSCYRNSVRLAASLGCKSIAFPLISSRGKHFPKEAALTTAIDAIFECLEEYPEIEIILAVYGKWIDKLPKDFFSSLSQQLQDAYKPGFPIKSLSLTAAEFSIDDLINHPTRSELDKIPVDENFAQMLNRLIEEKKPKTNDILDQLAISGAALSKLRNGKNNPSKMTAFALAIFFHLNLEETKDLLMKAGFAINPSSIQDLVLAQLIDRGIYDRYQIDDLLYDLDLSPLPGAYTD